MNDIYVDPALGYPEEPPIPIINQTGIETERIIEAATKVDGEFAALMDKPLLDALVTWSSGTRGYSNGSSRAGGLFDRDRFVAPDNPYEQMKIAYDAAEDDVVASFLDSSEALAFSNIAVECNDEDEQDIWDQISIQIDLDNRMREIWRELNIVSHATVATWFGTKDFKVRGKTQNGITRKKTFNNLTVPLGITVLDPLKVVPVGNFLFGQETLCYFADPTERDVIDSWLLGDDASGADPIIQRLIVAKYEPDFRDRKQIGNLGIDPNRLYVLNPKYVWRHSTTRPGYARFAPIRMKSVFELLDLKRQLKASDRATLIGASNFIILVRKGTDKEPAKQFEIDALQSQVRVMSKVPVIVGDHRLSIEIITPKTDHTVDEMRYSVLDLRISGRLYGMFITTHAGRDDSLKLARVVARGLESRRYMQRRAFMQNVIIPTYELNDSLRAMPDMVFHPKRISLDFDPSLATFLLDLRDRGDLSRASILSEVDYDEASEAEKRQVEKDKYDEIFTAPATSLPPGTPGIPGVPKAPPPPPLARPAAGTTKATPTKSTSGTANTSPGSPSDPKRAGRAQGGNHGKGGNGNIGRGGGQAPRAGSPAPQTPKSRAGAPKLKSRPKLTHEGDPKRASGD